MALLHGYYVLLHDYNTVPNKGVENHTYFEMRAY